MTRSKFLRLLGGSLQSIRLYQKANLNVMRKIEGQGLTMERLGFIEKVRKQHHFEDGFLYAHLGEIPRDDLAPALADRVQQDEVDVVILVPV